jgi:hypothetical protein
MRARLLLLVHPMPLELGASRKRCADATHPSPSSRRYFGSAAAAVDYFARAGFGCPPQFNPGDYLIDVTSMDYRSPDAEATTRRRIQLLGDLYLQQGAATAVRPGVAAASAAALSAFSLAHPPRLQQPCVHLAFTFAYLWPPHAVLQNPPTSPPPIPRPRDPCPPLQAQSQAEVDEESRRAIQLADRDEQFANNVLTEFRLLLGRAWRQAARNRPVQIVTAVQTVVIGLMLAWLYSDMSQTSLGGIQDVRAWGGGGRGARARGLGCARGPACLPPS